MLLATVMLWALNFTASKYILQHGFRPLAYSSVRYAAAALLCIGIVLPRERSLRIGRADLPLLILATALVFANQLCFVYALEFTTATTVALLFGTLPIFSILISSAIGFESLTPRFWGAALVSFAGVAAVAAGSGGELSADLKGDALALGGAATWAGYSVVIASMMRRYSPFRLSATFLLAVTIPLTLAASHQLSEQSFDFEWGVWVAFAYAVVGPLVVTNLTWFTALDRVGPARASLFANLQPFLAAIVALVLLSESITLVQALGGIAIGAGIVIGRGRRTPLPAPAAAE
jgi:drug/metabolite transporter (DMT)-like permease